MITSKTFRLFISSTFNDMRAERDILQEKVFPKLRKYCNKHGFSFQAIDLRWGVSEEAGYDQKTMQICIDEVKRCKNALPPHFAILLGERYGWIPLPHQIVVEEFELIKKAILKKYSKESKEVKYLEEWYKKDENAKPNVYKLQPRIKKEHQDWKYWEDVEKTLRNAFKSVIKKELKDKLSDKQKFKYIKSATEQEIIEGLFHNKDISKKHIYFFHRKFENLKELTEKDFKLLEQKDKEYRKKDNTYQITVKHFLDFKNQTENKVDEEIRSNLEKLINNIKSELPAENINEKLKIFIGREEYLSKIDSYIKSKNSNAPLIIYGDSGSGKSALMAKAISLAQKKQKNKNTTLIYRFIGISELSNTPINLLSSIYHQLNSDEELKEIFNQYVNENNIQLERVLSNEKELSKMLAYLIENYPDSKKLILFIDALDQFVIKDKLIWLPRKLKSNTKIIISTLPDTYQGIDYLPRLKQKYKDKLNYLELKKFKKNEEFIYANPFDEYKLNIIDKKTNKKLQWHSNYKPELVALLGDAVAINEGDNGRILKVVKHEKRK